MPKILNPSIFLFQSVLSGYRGSAPNLFGYMEEIGVFLSVCQRSYPIF